TKQVTLLEVLDRAADAVGSRFHDRPMVEAAVRDTIGDTYASLGENAKGEKHRRTSLEIYRTHLGPAAPQTRRAMRRLAGSLSGLGRNQEAIELLQQSMNGLSVEDFDMIAITHELARTYISLGRYTEAVKLDKETLQLCKAKLGPDHNSTIS